MIDVTKVRNDLLLPVAMFATFILFGSMGVKWLKSRSRARNASFVQGSESQPQDSRPSKNLISVATCLVLVLIGLLSAKALVDCKFATTFPQALNLQLQILAILTLGATIVVAIFGLCVACTQRPPMPAHPQPLLDPHLLEDVDPGLLEEIRPETNQQEESQPAQSDPPQPQLVDQNVDPLYESQPTKPHAELSDQNQDGFFSCEA